MRKTILKIGKVLNKTEQKLINGGDGEVLDCQIGCKNIPIGHICFMGPNCTNVGICGFGPGVDGCIPTIFE